MIIFISCCQLTINLADCLESANENSQKMDNLSQKPTFSAEFMGKMMANFFKELQTNSKMPNFQDFNQQNFGLSAPTTTTTTTTTTSLPPLDYEDMGKGI